ncbi:Aste57867_24627 [Aphanomyces stellatus]|uniref:Aste57867_24627 protein n=1 Tax=Aphanomyces stellatus TaxID=120398 RepID=A0A485LQZ8_9STRA|nr:hypothetical protein As57867_024549 [Aphanomyces stellatus]VFU01264.1 Aste57867_24627 [Aphanomyces stellatus]
MAGQYDDAKAIFEAYMDDATRSQQSAEIQLFCRLKMGQLYVCQGDVDKAHSSLDQAHDGFKMVYTPTHVSTRTALYCHCFVLYEHTFQPTMAQLTKFEDELKLADCFDETCAVFPCQGCFELIPGTNFACPECSKLAGRFCGACVKCSTERCWRAWRPLRAIFRKHD